MTVRRRAVRGVARLALAGLIALCTCCNAPEPLLSRVPETCSTPSFCASASRTALVRGDPSALARILRRACDRREHEACAAAIRPLTDSSGFVHAERVRPFLEQDCNLGDADACNALAHVVRPDDEVAATWFEKGCALGSGVACHELSLLMLSGAIPRSERRLTHARERACQAGIQDDCPPSPPDPRKHPR